MHVHKRGVVLQEVSLATFVGGACAVRSFIELEPVVGVLHVLRTRAQGLTVGQIPRQTSGQKSGFLRETVVRGGAISVPSVFMPGLHGQQRSHLIRAPTEIPAEIEAIIFAVNLPSVLATGLGRHFT